VRKVSLPLRRLYVTTFPFGMACGISIALTALHLDARGFTKQDIGTLSLFFASGLVLFAIPVGALIRRFSAERMLALMLFGYTACVSAFPFLPSFGSIAAVRFVDGLCSVGVWVSSETILLAQARKEYKAYLTTLYAIWLALGYVVGPISAWGMSYFVPTTVSFQVAALFALCGGIFVLLRMPPTPPVEEAESADKPGEASDEPALGAASILWRIKTSCFAAYSYGYFQASVVLFLPLYLIESKGIPRERTIVLPGLFCLGMLVCSNVAGRIADEVGHLKTVRVLSAIGLCSVLGFVFLDSYWLMLVVVFMSGATFASMSPVALALTGVVVEPRDYSKANSIYNVFYAGGMLMGPPIASYIFQRWGGITMLYQQAALWAVFVVFTAVFMYDDPKARKLRDAKKTAAHEGAGLPGGAAG